ncbi:hypothetical protein SAMN05421688_0854 [Poseidonocella pacifica]|uniref:T4 bacteriophage base plate protein n=1 Tax=Poseidonocella pacifica TaxID=871651 RepID=A0A1I0VPZ2_9RHOB|nr:hypothetical protein [Poseidonocella pacifica]SFA78371.1 hypothetical protein SAMN05421688_0854 [Poseidonocella pacifica]
MTPDRQPQTESYAVRAYGAALDDVGIDPLAGPCPDAAARVLAACSAATDAAPLDWQVNRRLQALLEVTIATRGPHWIHSAQCTACGAAMDMPLRLDDFLQAVLPTQTLCRLDDGREVTVAVPTGADQLGWLDDGARAADLLAHLVRPQGPLSDADHAAIEASLEAADPLRTLEIKTECPDCGTGLSLPLDLEMACLALLATRRPELLDDIHLLAMTYHWSEAEIMAIPPDRRAAYLSRIEGAWA